MRYLSKKVHSLKFAKLNQRGASTVEYALVIFMAVAIVGIAIQIMGAGSDGFFKGAVAKVTDFFDSGSSNQTQGSATNDSLIVNDDAEESGGLGSESSNNPQESFDKNTNSEVISFFKEALDQLRDSNLLSMSEKEFENLINEISAAYGTYKKLNITVDELIDMCILKASEIIGKNDIEKGAAWYAMKQSLAIAKAVESELPFPEALLIEQAKLAKDVLKRDLEEFNNLSKANDGKAKSIINGKIAELEGIYPTIGKLRKLYGAFYINDLVEPSGEVLDKMSEIVGEELKDELSGKNNKGFFSGALIPDYQKTAKEVFKEWKAGLKDKLIREKIKIYTNINALIKMGYVEDAEKLSITATGNTLVAERLIEKHNSKTMD